MTSLILSISGAAKLLGVTENSIRMRVHKKQIPHRRWSKRVFILRRDLEEFLQSLDGTSVEEALHHIESGT